MSASIIIPAHDEAAHIGPCLEAVLASPACRGAEVLVIANGCTDDTAAVAGALSDRAQSEGVDLRVLETPQGGKLHALQIGDEAAKGAIRIYLDADVSVSPELIPGLIAALDGDVPRYASGRAVVAGAKTVVTRQYARFWQRLPFVTCGVPGFGLFAVNAAGRARWGAWPGIISDDTFARLHFAPNERVLVPHPYRWPMVEGLGNLIRVRRRQDRGVQEIARQFPHLLANRDPSAGARRQKAAAALRDPVGFLVYSFVALCVRLPLARQNGWDRGR